VFRVKCPCCGKTLEIDEIRREVLRSQESEEDKQKPEEKFGAGLERVRRAKEEQARMFAEAQEREKSRKQRLASLFDEASKKAKEEGPVEGPPKRYWD